MAVSRFYSSSAVATTLTAPISDSATVIAVGSVSGFPIQYPFTLSLDADNVNKELVEVTGAAGVSLTVTRGVDGTSAVAHSLGAKASHDHSARDFRESREHEVATTGVHGVAGAAVGTTDTQALSNKTLASPVITGTPTGLTKAHVGLDNVDNTADASKPVSTATQTALNLKAPIASPTFTGTVSGVTKAHVGLSNVDNTSDVNKAVSTATTTQLNLKAPITTTVTLTGTQTLTNKTLTAPVISGGGTFSLLADGTGDWPALRAKVNTDRHFARRGKTAAQSTSSTGANAFIVYDTEIETDVGVTANVADDTFTITQAARYNLNAGVAWTADTGTGVFTATILVNGTPVAWGRFAKRATNSDNVYIPLDATLQLAVSDTVQVQVSQTTGNSILLLTSGGATYFNKLSIEQTSL